MTDGHLSTLFKFVLHRKVINSIFINIKKNCTVHICLKLYFLMCETHTNVSWLLIIGHKRAAQEYFMSS